MHKYISFIIGGLLGLGLALAVNTAHDVTVDQSAKIAEQGERIEKLEAGILRHLCFSMENGDYSSPSADLLARCKAR